MKVLIVPIVLIVIFCSLRLTKKQLWQHSTFSFRSLYRVVRWQICKKRALADIWTSTMGFLSQLINDCWAKGTLHHILKPAGLPSPAVWSDLGLSTPVSARLECLVLLASAQLRIKTFPKIQEIHVYKEIKRMKHRNSKAKISKSIQVSLMMINN